MIVASDDSEIARMVKKHQNGRAFLSNDYQGMRSFIMELKNNPDTYSRLSDMSLQASKEYSRRNAARYLEIYTS
jgi:glycosyltransferase involved in cell wall biosynthesis